MKTLNLADLFSSENKKNILAFTLMLLFSIPMQSQISVGGGLGYNRKIAGPGVTLKAEFHITKEIAVSPDASYFFGRRIGSYRSSAFAVNCNAHYFFDVIDSKLKIYPLLGLNYTTYKSAITFFSVYNEVNDNAIGGNLGAGARWAFSEKLSAYLEPKYIIGDYNQVVINAGVLLKL